MTITKEQVTQWARECGTPYVNRHFPDRTSYGFDEQTLLKFAQLAYEAGKSAVSEPVAWRPILANPIPFVTGKPRDSDIAHWCDSMGCEIEYAYTTPPAEAKPLTDEQIHRASLDAGMQEHYMGFHSGFTRFARAIEAAHGIGAKE